MLATAQTQPVVVLHPQTPAQPQLLTERLDAYHASLPTAVVPPPAVMPITVSMPVPVPVPVQMPVPLPMPMQLPTPLPTPRPVQQKVENATVAVPPQERILAVQLAHLASQHHASDYNKLRFGQKGSSAPYVPLSLQAPAHVREVRAKQASNANQKAWWISDGKRCKPQGEPSLPVCQEKLEERLPAFVSTTAASDISQEISAAISSQMVTTHITKTSLSHPINISMVIPLESLQSIVSRLARPSSPSPTMFHLHPEVYQLHQVTAVLSRSPFYRYGNSDYSAFVRPPIPVTWVGGGSSDLQNALNAEFTVVPPRPFVPSQDRFSIRPLAELPPHTFPVQLPTPPSPPRGVVRRRHRNGRATSAPPALRSMKSMLRRTATNQKEPRQCLQRNKSSPEVPTKRMCNTPADTPPLPVPPDSSARPEVQEEEDELSNNTSDRGLLVPPTSVDATLMTPPVPLALPTENSGAVQRLGNLYLSSCPGKKVRLTGPVKGRSAICRDVRTDLMRIKELGVGCIICCLDDTELDFLGASWTEYSSIANELGLDVLRIPMPEGFAPLSPSAFDSQLKCVIDSYTLRGIPVLAHCRGGVGRAGLVACCWILKLGLCGWKDTNICAQSCGVHATCSQSSFDVFNHHHSVHHEQEIPRIHTSSALPVPGPVPVPAPQSQTQPHDQISTSNHYLNVPRVCRATLQLVERVLAIVRRRRSLKAVETYEQVRFLVEYIEYLDAEARSGVRSLLQTCTTHYDTYVALEEPSTLPCALTSLDLLTTSSTCAIVLLSSGFPHYWNNHHCISLVQLAWIHGFAFGI